MFRFIHTADIHLDSPMRKLEKYDGAPVNALRQATRRALDNLIDLAVKRKVDFVLIAGDLYDGSWKDYNTGLHFTSCMAKLKESGIRVYLITGNHDAASKMTKTLQFPDNVHLFPTDSPETHRLDDIGVAIHGQGYAHPMIKKNLAKNYPLPIQGYYNIGLLHTGFNGIENHEPYAPCSADDLLSKSYDYWALGHIHRRMILHEDPPILFSGNIQGRNIREPGPKGCLLVNVDDHHRTEITFEELDVIRWAHCLVDVSGAQNGYDALETIENRLREIQVQNASIPMAVRVEARGHSGLAANPDRWANEIRSIGIEIGQMWIEKIKLYPPQKPASPAVPEGPVGEILRFFTDVRSNPVAYLENVLDDVLKKLPPELSAGKDAIKPDDPDWLIDMLDRVEPLLLDKLMPNDDNSK